MARRNIKKWTQRHLCMRKRKELLGYLKSIVLKLLLQTSDNTRYMTFWGKRIPMKLIWRGGISKPSRDTAADKTANFLWQVVDGWATFCIITVLPLINHSYCKKGTSITVVFAISHIPRFEVHDLSEYDVKHSLISKRFINQCV